MSIKQTFGSWTQTFGFWFSFLLSFTLAQTAQNITDFQNFTTELTASAIASGVICLVFGLLLLFAGYRLLKPMLFLAGLYVFTILGFAILTKAEPAAGYPNSDAVLFWGSIAIGVLGGILSLVLLQFGLTMLGALAGFCLAVFILSLKSGGLIESSGGRIALIVCLCLLGAILIHFFEKPLIIVCSSMAGSYSIVYGIDTFAKVGYVATLRAYANATFTTGQIPKYE
jgi:hypothetical protein